MSTHLKRKRTLTNERAEPPHKRRRVASGSASASSASKASSASSASEASDVRAENRRAAKAIDRSVDEWRRAKELKRDMARAAPVPEPSGWEGDIVWVNAEDRVETDAERDELLRARAVINNRVQPLRISTRVGEPPCVLERGRPFTTDDMTTRGFGFDGEPASEAVNADFLLHAKDPKKFERRVFYGLELKDGLFWQPSPFKLWRTGLGRVADEFPGRTIYAGMVATDIDGRPIDDAFTAVGLAPSMRINAEGRTIDTWDSVAVWKSALPTLLERRDPNEVVGCRTFRHALLVVYVKLQ